MQFAGKLSAIETKSDETNVDDEGALIEVVDFINDGNIQIAWTDRNERCYLTFRLSDLMLSLAEHAGGKSIS